MNSSIVPENETGASSDNSHSIVMDDLAAATRFFGLVRQRLLNVNQWQEYCGAGSARFRVTDEKGNELLRPVQLGDLIKIDIPGPGPVTGSGKDWVQVEAIEDRKDHSDEVLAIRVRPTDNPRKAIDDTAHFFDPAASSTFSVTRKGTRIEAAVNGRNEKPNLDTASLVDKVRNAVVATGAMMGLNKKQWNSLVKGLLQPGNE